MSVNVTLAVTNNVTLFHIDNFTVSYVEDIMTSHIDDVTLSSKTSFTLPDSGNFTLPQIGNFTLSDSGNFTLRPIGNFTLPFSSAYQSLGFACSIAMIIISLAGALGNAAAIKYFGTKSNFRSTINATLIALSTFDLILLITGAPIYSLLGIYSFDPRPASLLSLSYCMLLLYPFSNMAQTGSVWVTTLISVERYLVVCRPFFARRHVTARRVRAATVAIAVLSAVYNGSRFWEYYFSGEGWPEPLLRSNQAYLLIYVHWFYFVFVYSVPFLIIAVFNVLVACGLREASLTRPRCQQNGRERREKRTTVMLLALLATFAFCNCLSWPLNAYETFAYGNTDDALFDFVSDLNNLLVLTHPLLNILVYLYFSSTFRRHCFPGIVGCSVAASDDLQDPRETSIACHSLMTRSSQRNSSHRLAWHRRSSATSMGLLRSSTRSARPARGNSNAPFPL